MSLLKRVNNPVLKNFQLILGGNILTQMIGLLSYIVLARLYSSEAFGKSGVFLSISYICSIFQTGQIYWAFFKEDSEELLVDSINFTFLTTPLLLVVFGVLAIFDFKDLGWYLVFIPIFSFVYSLLEINKNYLNSLGEYKSSIRQVFFARMFGQGFKILAAFFSNGSLALILSEFLGNLIFVKDLISKVSAEKLKLSLISRYRSIVSYYVPLSFYNLFIQELPILMASFLYGFKESGSYFLLNRLVISPLILVGNSFGSSQIKKINSLNADKNKKRHFLAKSYVFMILLGIVPSIVIYFFGEEIFALFAGKNHLETVSLLSLIAFILPFRLIKGLVVIIGINSDLHRETTLFRTIQVIITCLIPVIFKGISFEHLILYILLIDTVVDIFLAVLGLRQSESLK